MEEVTEVFERAQVYVSTFKFVKEKNRDLEKFKSEIEEIFVDEPESLHPSEVHAFFE
jgi:hypothetical protein